MRKTSRVEKKIRRKKLGLMMIILFLTISVFFVMFTQTDFFNVSGVEIKNNIKLQEEEIVMASGLIVGKNIFMIDTSDMETGLAKHPYIKSAEVKRDFPNSIVIDIEERKEFAVLYSVGSYILLDKEGIILDMTQNRNDIIKDIPQVNVLNIDSGTIGEKVNLGGDEGVEELIEFLDLCKGVGIYDKISKIEINKDFGLNFEVKSGTKVAFGDLNNVKYKLSFATQVLNRINEEMSLSEEEISRGLIDLTQGEDVIFTIEAE